MEREAAAAATDLSLHFLHTRVTPQSSAHAQQGEQVFLNNSNDDWLVTSTPSSHWLSRQLSSVEVIHVVPPKIGTVAAEGHSAYNSQERTWLVFWLHQAVSGVVSHRSLTLLRCVLNEEHSPEINVGLELDISQHLDLKHGVHAS